MKYLSSPIKSNTNVPIFSPPISKTNDINISNNNMIEKINDINNTLKKDLFIPLIKDFTAFDIDHIAKKKLLIKSFILLFPITDLISPFNIMKALDGIRLSNMFIYLFKYIIGIKTTELIVNNKNGNKLSSK